MTLVAYKDGIICADTMSMDGLEFPITTRVIKVGFYSDEDGAQLFGAAGSAATVPPWLNWLRGGEKGERPTRESGSNFDPVFCAHADGRVRYWASSIEFESRGINRGRGFGVGFSSYLEGMMHAGLDAISAVRMMIDDGYRNADYPLTVLSMTGGAALIVNPEFAVADIAGAGLFTIRTCAITEYGTAGDPNSFLRGAMDAFNRGELRNG